LEKKIGWRAPRCLRFISTLDWAGESPFEKKLGWRVPRCLRFISTLDWAGESPFEKNGLGSPMVFEIHFKL